MKSYIARIRKIIGQKRLIHPAARILIENESGEILFIERTDNGQLGLPAGALEENESIETCIIREVFEETGLQITSSQVIGLSTHPDRETVRYLNGDLMQYFTVEFYCNSWNGQLKVNDPSEIKSVAFKNRSFLAQLPQNEKGILESWTYFHANQKILVR